MKGRRRRGRMNMGWAGEERKVCERSVGKLGGMRKRGCRMFVMAGGRMGGRAGGEEGGGRRVWRRRKKSGRETFRSTERVRRLSWM